MLASAKLKISICGTGYVGLVTGLCLAELGHQVTCVDLELERINMINKGQSPIYEKGLDALLTKHLGSLFFATTNLEDAVLNSDITIIAVGTPFDGKEIDLTYIKQAALSIGKILKVKTSYHVVAVKSTVVPGTTDDVVRPLLETGSGKCAGEAFGVCMNPEFLREGEAINDSLFPDRIVIGGMDQSSIDSFSQIYAAKHDVPIMTTNNKTAELIKYTSNALFATLISFSNEIASMCERIGGVDSVNVMEGLYLDRRITSQIDNVPVLPGLVDYLKAGCGFGGSCFPKDVQALVAHGAKLGLEMNMLQSTLSINDVQSKRMVAKLSEFYTSFDNLRVGVLGIAFKSGTDDIRCSPALKALDQLIALNVEVMVYDPIVKELPEQYENVVHFAPDLKDMLKVVDVLMVFTAWPEFQCLPDWIQSYRDDLVVIDGRRMFKKESIKHYSGIGLS